MTQTFAAELLEALWNVGQTRVWGQRAEIASKEPNMRQLEKYGLVT